MHDSAEIKRIFKTTNTENLKLRQTVELHAKMIKHMDNKIEDRGTVIVELRSEIKKMGRKLRIHDNHNTPPSQKTDSNTGQKAKAGKGMATATVRQEPVRR